MTIHLVYPFNKDRIAAPWSIGNHLGEGLRSVGHEIKQYDWMEKGTIISGDNDILLGHPHPNSGFIFTNSLDEDFAKRIAITPWNTTQYDMLAPIAPLLDHMLLICGEYWFSKIPNKWLSKSSRLDMAINKEDFPFIKKQFNKPGERKFLYIGCGLGCKGVDYLTQLTKEDSRLEVSHMGLDLVPGTYPYGYVDFSTKKIQNFVAKHDFLIMPGRKDANPTTVLEAISWGLIPICTLEAGWTDPPAIHIPLDNVSGALQIINYWQRASMHELECKQKDNFELLKNYAWNKFVNKVLNVIKA